MRIPCRFTEYNYGSRYEVHVDYRGAEWFGYVYDRYVDCDGDGGFYLAGEIERVDEDYVYVKIKRGDFSFETLRFPNYTDMDLFYV
jgi:hypothetical protein